MVVDKMEYTSYWDETIHIGKHFSIPERRKIVQGILERVGLRLTERKKQKTEQK